MTRRTAPTVTAVNFLMRCRFALTIRPFRTTARHPDGPVLRAYGPSRYALRRLSRKAYAYGFAPPPLTPSPGGRFFRPKV